MFAIPFAVLMAALFAGVSGGLALISSKSARRAGFVGVTTFIVAFIMVWAAKYLFMVEEVGYLGGYGYLIVALAVSTAAGAGVNTLINARQSNRSSRYEYDYDRGRGKDKEEAKPSKFGAESFPVTRSILGGAVGLLVVVLFIGWFITNAVNFWGPGNHTRRADNGHITMASATDKALLPDTDPNEILTMTLDTAYNRAHTAIGATGNNLGSRYVINHDEGVQQTIAGRNYFVFPLELNGWTEQVGFMSQQVNYGAGYIAVPAWSPTEPVKIVDNLHLNYLPGSSFSLNLQRHLYELGYTHGKLEDPTIELDDNWHVYFTVTYVTPAFVTGGQTAAKTLIVDPATGGVQEYDVDKTPAWVDRVISGDMVDEYVKEWGLFNQVNSWFNSSGNGQMKEDNRVLLYTSAEHSVWMVTMTSNTNTDSSSTGVILYDTRQQKGVFYPGAAGLALSTTLTGSFEKVQGLTQHYDVDAIQFYKIRGVKTWVAIYSLDHGDAGKSFAGIGFLDAENANASDVRFGTSREQALDNYYAYLDTRGDNGDSITESVTKKTLTGKIFRIGASPLNGQFIYTIVLSGDARIFTVPATSSKLLPVAQPGDQVTLSFDEPVKARTNSRSVDSFDDVTVAGAMQSK
jgi:hypothetical protein